MSSIASQLRIRYRAKLVRPAPESVNCANSSQVRRMIDLIMNPKKSLYQQVRAHQRLLVLATIAFVTICGGITYSILPSTQAAPTLRPLSVATLVLSEPERATVPKQFAGTVLATQRSELGFARSGRIKHRFVSEGDCVEAGALLAELDTSSIEAELSVARSELKLAENKLKSLQSSQATLPAVRRTRSSLSDTAVIGNESLSMSRTQIEYWASVINRLETQLEECQLRSPYRAVVTKVTLSDGSVVTADRPFLHIVGDEDLLVRVPMPMELAETLTAQSSYEFAIGTQTAQGYLKTVLPDINVVDQTRDVLFRLPELSGTSVGVGTQACLQVPVPTGKIGFLVPKTAVRTDKAGSSYVAVVRSDSKAANNHGKTQAVAYRTPVEVLQSLDKWLIIRGELHSRDRLVAVLREHPSVQQPVQYSDLAQWRFETWLNLEKSSN